MSTELQMALAATILSPMVFVLHVFLCRVFGARHAVRWMFTAFLAYLFVFVVVTIRRWGTQFLVAEALGTGFATVGFCCLGYMEAFSMLCRGFSLNVLVQLAGRQWANLDEIIAGYGGVGADGLLQKRLASLEKLRLIDRRNSHIALRGRAAAVICRLTAAYMAVFKMGAGG